MENTGQAKTTLFEHVLSVGLGIFDVACDSASATVEKPRFENDTPDEPKQSKIRGDN